MNRQIVKIADAYKVEIFIGGDFEAAAQVCLDYCDMVGLCVTVEPTLYVYKGGTCEGVRIGLINYARFPTNRSTIWCHAETLAERLKRDLEQGSYTVQNDKQSMFVSTRDEDQ